MSLREEIAADIASGDLADLFQDCTLNGKAAKAMVSTTATIEGMDAMGGTMLSGERQFKFERQPLLEIKSTLKMLNDVITFAGRTYDVTEIDDRPGHPIVIINAVLRP